MEKSFKEMDRDKKKERISVPRTSEKGEKMNQEKRRKESDLFELRRKEKGKEKKQDKGATKGNGVDQGGKKRRQRSFVDQWDTWKETERRLRRCTSSKKEWELRKGRKSSLKETGRTEESVKRLGVNVGKLERERKRPLRKSGSENQETSGQKGESLYTVLGIQTKNREQDLIRVRKLRNQREARPGYEKRGYGRKGIGRKTETNGRIWRNPSEGHPGAGRRENRQNLQGSGYGCMEVKKRYQKQRRQSLSRRRVQSRYPFLSKEVASKKEGRKK